MTMSVQVQRLSHAISAHSQSHFVGILMPGSSPEFYIASFAAVLSRRASVLLHATWTPSQVAACVSQTGLDLLFASRSMRRTALDAARAHGGGLRELVEMDAGPCVPDDEQQAAEAGVRLSTLQTFVERAAPGCASDGDGEYAPSDIVALMFTSGSTGDPKPVCVSAAALVHDVEAPNFLHPLVVCSFTPAALAADYLTVWGVVLSGGRVAFKAPDCADLLAVLRAAAPAVLSAPPLLWATLHTEYVAAVAAEVRGLPDPSPEARDRVEAEVMADFRRRLGGRLRQIGTGGAACSPTVLEWMARCFACATAETYGATEVGGIATNGVLNAGVEVRLRDLPALGFTAADAPFPRGELLVRTPAQTSGYYGMPERTREAIDDDGWYVPGLCLRSVCGCALHCRLSICVAVECWHLLQYALPPNPPCESNAVLRATARVVSVKFWVFSVTLARGGRGAAGPLRSLRKMVSARRGRGTQRANPGAPAAQRLCPSMLRGTGTQWATTGAPDASRAANSARRRSGTQGTNPGAPVARRRSSSAPRGSRAQWATAGARAEQGTWGSHTRKPREAGCGRPEDRGA